MSNISSNIKKLRIEYHLTQEEFAKIVGKKRPLISQWESDTRKPLVEDIVNISQHFNIPMDELIGNDILEDKIIMPVDTNKYKKGEEVTANQLVDYITELQDKLNKIKENL